MSLTEDPTPEGPRRIGPYRIVRELGRGGMGVVYLAEQEEPIRRSVALKVVKLGMDTREVIGRFEAERQALALMSHPNIARILDAGATESGRPYFVMEYVRGGEPITTHCDRKGLPLRERLALFSSLCRAVHHAHGNGVIHRDLKPSNLLVSEEDGRPVPKVIDFGVAKALVQPLTDHTALSKVGGPVGTPGYMSPEQALGGKADPRSDVFSLGAVLYELVTGTELRPRDTGALSPADWARDATLPSARVRGLDEGPAGAVAAARGTNARQLVRDLKGDLDWITLRALEVDPGRRYPAVADLADEIDRLLAARPVTPAPSRLAYRAGRRLRRSRNRLLAAGAVLVLAAALLMRGREPEVEPGPVGPQAVAVLPLDEIGQRTALGDGLHQSLIAELSGVEGLSVISRGSVLPYRDTDLPFSAIGSELGVSKILEGTVQTANDRLRVVVRLVEARDGRQIWGEQYDQPYRVDALLDIQREIASRVADALSANVLPRRPRLTSSLPALEAYYEGNAYYAERYERSMTDSAIAAFERAIESDPDFGVAYAALADARIWRFWQFAEGADRGGAEAALARARELAPDAFETRLAEGFLAYRLRRDFDQALQFFVEAAEVAPGDPALQESIGYVHRRMGNWNEAVERLGVAARLSPYRPGLMFSLGHTYHMMRRFVEAESWFDELTEVEPRSGPNGPFEARMDLYLSLGDTAALRSMVSEVTSDARDLRLSIATTLAFYGRRYDEALETGGALRLWPYAFDLDGIGGRALLMHLSGDHAGRDQLADSMQREAESELATRGVAETDARARAYARLALAHAFRGNPQDALAAVQASHSTLNIETDAYSGRFGEQRLAVIYLLLGDVESAFQSLDALLAVPNEVTEALIDLDPRADVLRQDPRFRQLIPAGRGL